MQWKRLIAVAASLATVCALVSLAVSGALPGSRSKSRERDAAAAQPVFASYLQVVGVQPMDFDKVSQGSRRDGAAWVLGEVDLEAVRAQADAAQDLDVLAHQDEKWIPTQTWKLRHGGASPFAVAKEHCSMQHLRKMERACKNDVDVVVERTGPGEGRVVYARPNLGPEADDECHAYSDCVARNAWLGRESPLPADADELHGFKAGDVHLPVQGSKDDLRAGFQDGIDVCKRNLLALSRLDQSDPSIGQNITLNEDLLEQLEWLMSL